MSLDSDSVKECLDLLAQGKTIEEIAGTVGLEMGDVQTVFAGSMVAGARAAVAGSTPGGVRIVKFDFAHDTPGLENGVAAYVPTIGEVLLDAWIDVTVAWNGVTPTADAAQAEWWTNSFGWWGNRALPVDLSVAGDFANAIFKQNANDPSKNVRLSDLNVLLSANPVPYTRTVPMTFTTAHPVLLAVTQDGSMETGAAGATQGAAILYVVVAQP